MQILLRILFVLIVYNSSVYANSCNKFLSLIAHPRETSSTQIVPKENGTIKLLWVEALPSFGTSRVNAFITSRRIRSKAKIAESAINEILLESLSRSFLESHERLRIATHMLESNVIMGRPELMHYRANIVDIIRFTELDRVFLERWKTNFLQAIADSKLEWKNSRDKKYFNETEWMELFDLIKFPDVVFYNLAIKAVPSLYKEQLAKIDQRLGYISSSSKSVLPALIWGGIVFGGPALITNGYNELAIPLAIAAAGIPLGIFIKDFIGVVRGVDIENQIIGSRRAVESILTQPSEELVQYQSELGFYKKHSIELTMQRLTEFREALSRERTSRSEASDSTIIGKVHRLISGIMLSTSFFTEHPFMNSRRITVERLELALALGLKMNELSNEDINNIQAELDTMTAQIRVLIMLKNILSEIIPTYSNTTQSNVLFSTLTRIVSVKLLNDLELQIQNLQASYDESASLLSGSETVFAYLNASQDFQLSLEQTLRIFQETSAMANNDEVGD